MRVPMVHACMHTPEELDRASLLHNAWMEKRGRVHDALPVLLEEVALEAPRRVDELIAVAVGVEEEVILIGVLVWGIPMERTKRNSHANLVGRSEGWMLLS